MNSSPVFHLIYRSPLKTLSLPATIVSCCIFLLHSEIAQAQPEISATTPELAAKQNSETNYSSIDEIISLELEPVNETALEPLSQRSSLPESNVSSIPQAETDLENMAATAISASPPAPTGVEVDWGEQNQPSLSELSIPAELDESSDRPTLVPEISQVPNFSNLTPESVSSHNMPVAQAVPSTVGLPAGVPIQWSTALPAQPAPPGSASPAGTWVMVWIPYGASTGIVDATGIPASVTTGSFPQPSYYPAWMPIAASPAVPPTPGISPAAGAAPGTTNYAYSAPPAGAVFVGSPGVGTTPQPYYFGQPYLSNPYVYQSAPSYPWPSGLVTPPAVNPLPVPNAPATANNIPALPSPPPINPTVAPTNPYPSYPPVVSPTPPVSAPTPIPATTQGVSPISTAATPLIDAPQAPLTEPNLDLQGLYILEGDDSSARARLSGSAFLTRYLLVGGALDLVTGPDLTNDDGVQLTELYLATALPGAPGLRFRFGQLDLTSYFDRNSFAKDASRDFFNATFQTNPALIAGANVTASRLAGLVQWNITDDLAFSGAVFSSDPDVADFALNGFAAEASFRTGDLIVRGTFISSEDTEFQSTGDRLESYGVNAEWFLPDLNIGLFGRYGKLNNSENDFEADTYSIGLNALDVFMDNDRLGVAYGRNLETDFDDDTNPDVFEVFYDFELLPNLRTGFSIQQRNSFSETYAGFRIRSDIDLTPSVFAD